MSHVRTWPASSVAHAEETYTALHKTYLSRGNSHLESRGSSTSMTPASMGVQLEERRVTRISDVVDFPEELDSKENCGDRPNIQAECPTDTALLQSKNGLDKGTKDTVKQGTGQNTHT